MNSRCVIIDNIPVVGDEVFDVGDEVGYNDGDGVGSIIFNSF